MEKKEETNDFFVSDLDFDNLTETPEETTDVVSKELQELENQPIKEVDVETTKEVSKQETEVKKEINSEIGAPPDDISTSSSDSSSSPYKLFAKASYEGGVLSEFDEKAFDDLAKELGESGALIELNKRTIKGAVEEYKDSLPKDVKDIIENYEEGVPLDEFIKSKSAEINYSNIDEEKLLKDDVLKKEVIKKDLQNRGYTDEEVTEEIELYYDAGEEDKKAKRALKSLIKFEKTLQDNKKENAKKVRKETDNRIESQKKELKTSINSYETIVPGVTLTQGGKDNIYKALTEIVDYTEDGKPLNAITALRLKNPMAFDTVIAQIYDLGGFNLDKDGNLKPDWTKFGKNKKSQTIDELDTLLKKDQQFAAGKAVQVPADDIPGSHIITQVDFDIMET